MADDDDYIRRAADYAPSGHNLSADDINQGHRKLADDSASAAAKSAKSAQAYKDYTTQQAITEAATTRDNKRRGKLIGDLAGKAYNALKDPDTDNSGG